MRSFKTLFVAALGLTSLGFTQPDQITLVRTLTENTTETYKVDSKGSQTFDSQLTGEVPMNVTTGMTYKIKTGKVDADKGKLDVEVTMSVDKLDADGPLGGQLSQQTIKPVVETGTLDKFGHFSLKPAPTSDMMTLAMAGAESTEATMFIEFPDHPVKVGDSWDINVPKSIFTGMEDQTIKAKLVGDKVLDGKDVWLVDISGKIHMELDSSKLPPSTDSSNPLAMMKFVMKGSVDLSGEGDVEKSTGRTLKLTSNAKMKTTVEIPDHDISMDATGTMDSTVTLQN